MPKTKQKAATPSQRRQQQRQQRQQQLAPNQRNQAKSRGRKSVERSAGRNTWLLIGGVLVVIAVVIGAFIILSRQQAGPGVTSVNPTVFKEVTQVDPNTLQTVGTGGVQDPLHAVKGPPSLLIGPHGKPEFFYAGAEYCPFCAAQRWSMVVALSRFGTFSHLSQTQSAEDNISTFTFYQSTYTSSSIDFVPVELNSNNPDGSGGYTTLQTPTADEQKLISTYDGPPYFSSSGSIPFIDIGNRYVLSGSSYSPQVLLDSSSQSLSWQDIANSLSDPTSPIAQNILGTANYLTAGICMMTQQQPANVCTGSAIQQIEQSLPKPTAVSANETQVTLVSGHFEAIMRRHD